jgi:hypothetical protein
VFSCVWRGVRLICLKSEILVSQVLNASSKAARGFTVCRPHRRIEVEILRLPSRGPHTGMGGTTTKPAAPPLNPPFAFTGRGRRRSLKIDLSYDGDSAHKVVIQTSPSLDHTLCRVEYSFRCNIPSEDTYTQRLAHVQNLKFTTCTHAHAPPHTH